jgi:hypothetical protein
MFGRQISLKREDDDFLFRNNSPFTNKYAFFAADYLINPPTLLKPIVVNNPLDYDELVRDKEVNPKNIKKIRLICDNPIQFANPMIWTFQDANGEFYSIADQPLNMLSPMQFQTRVLDINYERLLIGQSEYMTLDILPNTDIIMIIQYDDYRLEYLLEDKEKLVRI